MAFSYEAAAFGNSPRNLCVAPSSVQATALPSLRSTAVLSASSDCSRRPAFRYKIPRFTYGADNCGNCNATCLNSSSASVLLPERMKPTARSKSALPRAVTGTLGTAPAAPVSPAVPPFAPGVVAPDFPALAVTGSDDASVGFAGGADPQAANNRANIAGTTAPATLTATPCWPEAMSVEARDHILRQLRLAVTGGFELGQHLEALLHPLVINTVFGASRVQLVRLDSLLLERIHLLLEQRVVFLELIALEILRPLGGHQVLRQRAIELGHLEGGGGRDLRNLVFGGLLIAIHRRLQRLALGDETLLQRQRQAHGTKLVACRLREGKLRLRRQVMGTLRSLRPRLAVDFEDLAVPVVPLADITRLPRVIREPLPGLFSVYDRQRGRSHELLEHRDGLRHVVGFRIEIGRLQQGLALYRAILGRIRRDLLELAGSLA